MTPPAGTSWFPLTSADIHWESKLLSARTLVESRSLLEPYGQSSEPTWSHTCSAATARCSAPRALWLPELRADGQGPWEAAAGPARVSLRFQGFHDLRGCGQGLQQPALVLRSSRWERPALTAASPRGPQGELQSCRSAHWSHGNARKTSCAVPPPSFSKTVYSSLNPKHHPARATWAHRWHNQRLRSLWRIRFVTNPSPRPAHTHQSPSNGLLFSLTCGTTLNCSGGESA